MIKTNLKFPGFDKNKGTRIHDSQLMYIIIKQGRGKPPEKGSRVSILYECWLTNGKLVDYNLNPDQPYSFKAENNEVIQGLDLGITIMKPGSIVLFYVPSNLGYGNNGNENIPKNADMIFKIKLLSYVPPISEKTFFKKNPCVAVAEIENILFCVIENKVISFSGVSREIIKAIFRNPIGICDLSGKFNIGKKEIKEFLQTAFDNYILQIT